jgi:8-oxo-dGTP pyrophosphatase MutT (NUDIX family)
VLPTDLTVSSVVEDDGRFLIIEERSSGVDVVNQPGGHIEAGESPERAAEREVLEETGCIVSVRELLGVYLWIHPQTRQNFLRIVFVADLLSHDPSRDLDDGIFAVHWYTLEELERRRRNLRTPMVLKSIEDYLAGRRQPHTLLADLMPVQQNVDRVLATAHLI